MTYPYHLYSRVEWGARPARPYAEQSRIREVFIHHTESADAGRISQLKQMVAAVQSVQNFHMDERGWSDIGYHFMVFQPDGNHEHATSFALRPTWAVPAAQLNHNTDTLAICVYGDGRTEALQRPTRYAIEALCRQFAPNAEAIGGHRAVVKTECPGGRFAYWVPALASALGIRALTRRV